MDEGILWQQVWFLRDLAVRDAQTAAAPPPVREGRVFASTLERLPVTIEPEATLAGGFAARWDTAGNEAALQAPFEAWQAQRRAPAPTPPAAPPAPDRWALLYERFHCFASDGGAAHTTVDYGRVVEEGISGVLASIGAELRKATDSKRDYLLGMREALRGLVTLAERFAALAAERAQTVRDPPVKARYLALAERCRHVPRDPAGSFREGLQTVWLVHLAVGLSESSSASLSLGRLDQYLYRLYEQDRADGVPAADLADALAELFQALNGFGDPACAVNLGPAVQAGAGAATGAEEPDCFNPLSRLILKVAKRLRLPSPVLVARIHPAIPDSVFDLFTDPDLLEIGQPTYYGEQPCREALRRRGVPAGELANWAVNSCMGLMMPGQEWSNMWGSAVNVLLPLEVALNGGRPFRHDLPLALQTRAPAEYAAFEPLLETVCGFLDELVDLLVAETVRRTARRGSERPNPFVTALLDDGVARGCDRLLGACRYHTVIVEAFGLVNAADALLAVQQLVFEQRRFTLGEMVAAAVSDYAGREDVLQAVLKVPKYGNGVPAADAMARRLAERFAGAVARHSTPDLVYAPSFHTLTAHLPAGARTAASLDGRRAGAPLAKNVGTCPGRAVDGPTALMRSAAAIDQGAFCGGQALDVWIDPGTLRSGDGRRAFQALLQTYFRLGGLQVQVNGVSPDTLRRAMADPESHRDVLVRIGGFTARFVGLSKTDQADLLARAASAVA